MTTRLIFEREPNGAVSAALIEEGRMVELARVRAEADEVGDALFLARVATLDRQLGGAFLDVGLAEPGYVAAKDARHLKGVAKKTPIDRLLETGQHVIVQGMREPGAGKGARFTTDIRLFGAFLVLKPHGQALEVSRRLRGRDRAQAEERARRLFPEGGVMLRRAAALVDDQALLDEARALRAHWQEVARHVRGRRPGRIAAAADPAERLLWQFLERDPASVEAADPALLARLGRLLERLPDAGRPTLERINGEGSAFARSGVAEEIERAMAREVPLERGGRLTIEPTLACVAVDVDGGGRPALEADLDAAAELALQARLRNLGGTLIVDFIDLPTKPQRQRLDEALKKAFARDPLPVQIYPMSPLGIVQISRARRGGSVLDEFTRPCPACDGSGKVFHELIRP